MSLSDAMQRFSNDLLAAKQRLADLENTSDPHTLAALLGQVQIHCEELSVADAELNAQVDELARMSVARDGERKRCRELFDFAPDPYLVTDTWGVIEDANVAASELIERDFFRGKPMTTLIERDDVARFRDALSLVRRSPRVEIELSLRSRKGRLTTVALVGAANASGARILWILRPVARPAPSPPWTLESGQRIEELERALAAKEAQLEIERGRREALEASHRTKNHFIAVLAHDLRAPMNAVLGWAQLLGRDELDAEARLRALTIVERNVGVQAELVRELLDLSRLRSDPSSLDLASHDLADIARRNADAIIPSADKRGIAITLDVEPGALTVRVDSARIDQVISNLLSNALTYTPAGGKVELEVKRAGAAVALVVRDTGAGIEAEALPHVFDGYAKRRKSYDGSRGLGLGLHIVARLVELHGGRVTVESAGVNCGTTFTVLLPAANAAPRTLDGANLPSRDALAARCILVVEDDPDTLDLLVTILSEHGARVTPCPDATRARAALACAEPDVIISDIGLPDRDGCMLMREIRGEMESRVPALALSAYTTKKDVHAALAAGFDAHLAKPVDPYALVSAIVDAIRSRSPRHERGKLPRDTRRCDVFAQPAAV